MLGPRRFGAEAPRVSGAGDPVEPGVPVSGDSERGVSGFEVVAGLSSSSSSSPKDNFPLPMFFRFFFRAG